MADISKIQLKGTNDEEVVYNIKDETARNEITNINNQINLKNTIFIGDSFIQMFPDDNWALSLKNKLGLSYNQVYIFGEGGAGMFNPRKCWT